MYLLFLFMLAPEIVEKGPARPARAGHGKGALSTSDVPRYGDTVKAGLGLTLRLVMVQLPLSAWLLALRVLVALLQDALTVPGPQFDDRMLKATPVTVPEVVLGTVRVQGRFFICGTLQRLLLPLTVALVMEAEAPLALTLPVKVMLQVTGCCSEAGERTVMVPGAVKDAPAGAMVAAVAAEAAPRQRTRAVLEAKVLTAFIFFFSSRVIGKCLPGDGQPDAAGKARS